MRQTTMIGRDKDIRVEIQSVLKALFCALDCSYLCCGGIAHYLKSDDICSIHRIEMDYKYLPFWQNLKNHKM